MTDDAFRAAAQELSAASHPGGISEDDALAILRRYGMHGPQQEMQYAAALNTLLGPQPESFAELLARQSILQHQLKMVEQALHRPASAPTPQQGGGDD